MKIRFLNIKENRIRLALLLAPFFALALFILFQDGILDIISRYVPSCPFNKIGLLCPGCGNTRAVFAAFHGHLIESIFYNPTILTGIIFLVMLYIEQTALLFGVKIKIIPRKAWVYVLIGILFSAYFILRNTDSFRWMTWISIARE